MKAYYTIIKSSLIDGNFQEVTGNKIEWDVKYTFDLAKSFKDFGYVVDNFDSARKDCKSLSVLYKDKLSIVRFYVPEESVFCILQCSVCAFTGNSERDMKLIVAVTDII